MISKTARELLLEKGYDDVIIFESPSFDTALIGVTDTRRAVYDFDKMVEWLSVTDGISMEDAIDFIEYNTIRSLPYCGKGAPLVVCYDYEKEHLIDYTSDDGDDLLPDVEMF